MKKEAEPSTFETCDVSLGRKVEPVTYINRFSETVSPPGTYLIHPSGQIDGLTSNFINRIADIFGPDFREKISREENTLKRKGQSRSFAVFYDELGWGHLIQAVAASFAIADVTGLPVYLVNCGALCTPSERQALENKHLWLDSVHHGRPFIPQGESSTLWEKFDLWIQKQLFTIADAQMKALGLENGRGTEKSAYDGLLRAIQPACDRIDAFNRIVYRFAAARDAQMDRMLSSGIVDFLEKMNAQAAFFTHPGLARSLIGTPYESQTCAVFPDPGYAGHEAIMVTFGYGPNNMLTMVADEDTAVMLSDVYGVRRENIFVAGTLGMIEGREHVMEKWQEWQSYRPILLSTSGKGANLDILVQGIDDLGVRLEKDPGTPYHLIIFLGHHGDDEVHTVLDAERRFRKVYGDTTKLEIIRTASPYETACKKHELQQKVLAEGAKGGEPCLTDPQYATDSFIYPPGGPNEGFNTTYAVRATESAIPSPWPAASYYHWKNRTTNGFASRSVPGFDRPFGNLFDFLDYQFGANPQGINFALERVKKGLERAKPNAALELSAMAVGQILPGLGGRKTKSYWGAGSRYMKNRHEYFFQKCMTSERLPGNHCT